MSDFVLPLGYAAWCHLCGRPPFNRTTEVEGKQIPGVGFKGDKAMDEMQEHELSQHRVWKG